MVYTAARGGKYQGRKQNRNAHRPNQGKYTNIIKQKWSYTLKYD